MTNKFALIGCSGIIISAICLTGAAMVASKSLFGADRSEWRHAIRAIFHGRDACPALSGANGTRTIVWRGGNEIELSLSADIRYRAGEGQDIVVTGDNALLGRVKVNGDEVEMDCEHDGEGLAVTLPGREFRSIQITGAGNVVLENINQRRLDLSVVGSGDVRASGKLEDLDLSVVGTGSVALRELVSEDGDVSVVGSGDVALSVTGDLDLNVIGSGGVTLHREPRRLESNVIGSGGISHRPDPVTPETPAAPAPAETPKGI